MKPLLNNESLEQPSGYSPFICLSVLDWSCSAIFQSNDFRGRSDMIDEALNLYPRGASVGDKKTFSRGEKKERFKPNA